MNDRFSQIIADKFLSKEEQEKEAELMRNAARGDVLYCTYLRNSIRIELYEALLDIYEIPNTKSISIANETISFKKA